MQKCVLLGQHARRLNLARGLSFSFLERLELGMVRGG